MSRTSRQLVVFLISLLASGKLVANPNKYDLQALIEEPESRLVEAIDLIEVGHIAEARHKLKLLLDDQPDFRLARLMYADLLAAAVGSLNGFGGGRLQGENESQMLDEAKRRYAHNNTTTAHDKAMIPELLLQVSPSQRRVIVVDSAQSRAHVFENGDAGLTLVDDYYVTIGKNGLFKTVEGDGRTPVGVYFITSRLNPLGLADLYGDGALPLNYPNEWDQRLGRTGYGIWLHGVPGNTYNRAPFATEGCIALPNMDIANLYDTPNIQDTPVIIAQTLNWVTFEENQTRRDLLLQRFEEWRKVLGSRDMTAYQQFYSRTFSNDKFEYDAWINHQRKRVETSLTTEPHLSDISLFQYPNDENLVVATFIQGNKSSTGNSDSKIRQYWRLESDDEWRVVYEDTADYQPVHFRGIPEAAMPIVASVR